MKKIYSTISILFFAFIMVMGIQTFWKFIPEGSLGGVEQEVKITSFNKKDWFSAQFQRSFDDYIKQNVALKDVLVKTNNQLDYDLFNENNSGGTRVVIGKKDWLFQQTAIDSGVYEYCSNPQDVINEVETLQKCYQYLRKYDKKVLFLAGPNKVDIYPEYVSQKYMKHKTSKPDVYDVLMTEIKSKCDMPYIDGREFFLKLKNEGDKDMFPQGGAHWSVYSSCLVLEEILNMTGYAKEPVIEYTNVPAHFMDTDLVELMNLWTPDVFAGPDLKYPVDSSKNLKGEKPSILFIGDSACHLLAYAAVHSELFSNVRLLYYNSSVVIHYKDKPKTKFKIDKSDKNKFNIYRDFLNDDIIVMSMSEQHMTFPRRMLAYGFPNFVVSLFEENPDFLNEK